MFGNKTRSNMFDWWPNPLSFGHIIWCYFSVWSCLAKFEIHQTSDQKAWNIAIVVVFDVWCLVRLADFKKCIWRAHVYFDVDFGHTHPRWLSRARLTACLIHVWPHHQTRAKFAHQAFYVWLELYSFCCNQMDNWGINRLFLFLRCRYCRCQVKGRHHHFIVSLNCLISILFSWLIVNVSFWQKIMNLLQDISQMTKLLFWCCVLKR